MRLLVVAVLLATALGAQTATTIINNGDSQNRIDLVIAGDGYTASEMNKFAADVNTFVQAFFAQDPYYTYQSYFNVRRVDAISQDSGASHPESGITRNTAFGSAYNCAGIQRLVCADDFKVQGAIAPLLNPSERDLVIVLVNDSEYGGSGGAIAVASTNPLSTEIALHELGHSFGLLADEYGGPPPPDCYLYEPTEANATMVTAYGAIKWNAWVDPATPLPTIGPTVGLPGLYQGAKYCDAGMFRPTYNSKMRSLKEPFEQVNTEQLVRRMYDFVSTIDASRPSETSLTLSAGQMQTFGVTSLLPRFNTITVTWYVDGEARGTGAQFTVTAAALGAGVHTVSAIARDTTALVRSDPNGVLTETVSWTVTAPSAAVPVPVNLSPVAGTAAAQAFDFTYSDPDGYQFIGTVAALFNAVASPAGGCYLDYNVQTGGFRLMNDSGAWAGPVAGGVLSNAKCSVDVSASEASGSGQTLTVHAAVAFKAAFGSGRKNIYLSAAPLGGAAGEWTPLGAWYPNSPGAALVPWYRLFDPFSHTHHFTTDENEYNVLAGWGFLPEGYNAMLYNAPISIGGVAAVPLYRIYVAPAASHFWTADRNEYLTLLGYRGYYVGEGVDGFVFSTQVAGSVPLYRLAHLYAYPVVHHWTQDRNEFDVLRQRDWAGEGVAAYVFAPR